MCNIAGYCGTQAAAPILIEMMRRQAGFGGGYYTGIATLHEGRLYHAKVLGDVDRLLAETDAAALPGNVGILHSRSNSGGDETWAHPFIGDSGKLAYVANGSSGVFYNREQADGFARLLEREGVVFTSRAPQRVSKYPCLADGGGVHVSEVVCHMIARGIGQGLSPREALRDAYVTCPSEVVGLALHTDCPGRILAARHNQPMMLGRAAGEAFMATTALAFPADRHFYAVEPLPVSSSAEISPEGVCVYGFDPPPRPVAPITPGLWRAAYERTEIRLREAGDRPVSLDELIRACADLWPAGRLPQKAMLTYEIIRDLLDAKKLRVVSRTEPGAPEGADRGVTTTRFYLRAVKAGG